MSCDKKKVCVDGRFYCKLEGVTRSMNYALDVEGSNEGVEFPLPCNVEKRLGEVLEVDTPKVKFTYR